jgi:drug/metabolite transporter (DMT)-like permease
MAVVNTEKNRVKPVILRQNTFKGFLLVIVGLFLFACMDSTTKYLAAHYNVPFVVFMRYITQCFLMVLVLAPRHSGQLIKTQRTGLVILRALALCAASLFVGLALQLLPVAETTAISFLAPMLVVLLSPLLGERISFIGWAAVVMGFIGVLLIVRPGSGLNIYGVLFCLVAAFANATYQLMSRLLASTEKAVALLFYTALIGSICFGLTMPWFWESRLPSSLEVIIFLAMGLFGGLGHYFFTLAYSHAPASMLSPVLYMQLLWAA